MHEPEQKKITVNKNDEVAAIAEKIIDAESDAVTLVIPRFSKLAESPVNVRLLKREAEALGKHLVVETVDERIIELCKKSGITCENPFFEGAKQIADISRGEPRVEAPAAHADAPHAHAKPAHAERAPHASAPHTVHREYAHPRKRSRRRTFVFGFSILLLVAFVWIGVRILPRADVRLVAEKFRIPEEALADSVTDTIIVDIAVSEVDLAQAIVPGQAFAQKKNLQLSFPASLTKEVAEKARGTITIYNAHSSEPQALVKTTRFETSDGKVYRLVDGITVPGAKIEDGKVIPSSITATVIADKAGSEYNIGAVQKFTIPGFKGSPKYETFYASSDAPMQGGFIGTVASPSETDLVNAKEIMEEELQKTLRNFMLAQLPNEFMLVDGAEMFRIVSHTVVPEQASADMFSLLSEAEMSITVFREADVLAMLEKKSESQAAVAYDVREHSLAYSVAAFADGALSVPVQYSATLARTIDTEILIEQMRGKSEDEVKTVIFGIPGLDSAEVSLWPFWVRRIPDDPEKIRVHVD